jgi:hypothetical protein
MSQATHSPEGYADAGLVVQLRAGDEAAVSRLTDQWSPTMLRVARSFVDSLQSAEDVDERAADWFAGLRGEAPRTWAGTRPRRCPPGRGRRFSRSPKVNSAYCATCRPTCRHRRSPASWPLILTASRLVPGARRSRRNFTMRPMITGQPSAAGRSHD